MTRRQERYMLVAWLIISIAGLALPVWLIYRCMRGLRVVAG